MTTHSTATDKRKAFRRLLEGDACIRPATAFDPLSALAAQELGYPAGILAGSIASLNVLGAPDIALLTLSELAEQARRICRACELPLLVDGDHGYGNALNVRRSVVDLEAAGIAALTIEDTLLPSAFGAGEWESLRDLSGLSLPVVARHRGVQFAENLLFTHRGISGPAVLQISSFWREGETLHLDLLPGLCAADFVAAARRERTDFPTILSRHWPRRFAEVWCAQHSPAKPLQQWNAGELATAVAHLEDWPLTFPATEGYAKAEVTLGGVDTRELSSKTMEARRVPGLFCIGEVVDVTGWLGGFNFQWAWASGHAAGQFA